MATHLRDRRISGDREGVEGRSPVGMSFPPYMSAPQHLWGCEASVAFDLSFLSTRMMWHPVSLGAFNHHIGGVSAGVVDAFGSN